MILVGMKSIVLLLVMAGCLLGQGEVRRESTEWCDAWMPHMNDKDLPRVMLIGDSITRGYFAAVEEKLKGTAYVARIATSKAIGDPALLDEVRVFLGQARFDVVHMNVGMHGWAYTEEEYRKHLPELYETVRKAAPGAKLIWAQTTPVRKDREKGPENARIEKRNAIAREFMSGKGVAIDDLHALMAGHGDLHSDDIHFNKEGSGLMAGQVAEEVRKLLPGKAGN